MIRVCCCCGYRYGCKSFTGEYPDKLCIDCFFKNCDDIGGRTDGICQKCLDKIHEDKKK